ncbi:hypothetical protein BJ973_009689 [Actinoplanes tereljensis]|uniref:Trypsin-co-occurring domain-containing protein n=1 Tax=Paractinoplanes tereljensis TaxID=571912 RepID=A0A919NEY6_9ACTN|nr:CU044_2847 family protein [Actinoplanes tereljensis]GIF17349.1 hypothetical protein Ate02nite_00790 [Actinoplanes tereljensis]
MGTIERFTTSDGASVIVAVPDEDGIVPTNSRAAQAAVNAVGSLSAALAPIRSAADDAFHSLREMASSPSRIEIEFGVMFTAQATAIIAGTKAGAQITVTVTWEKP